MKDTSKNKISLKTKTLNIFRKVLIVTYFDRIVPIIIRLIPQLYKIAPNNYQYANLSFRKVTRNGIQIKLNLHDYIGHWIYFNFKDKGRNELIRLSKDLKNHVIFDIGANNGFTGLILAKKSGKKVYSFEPDPDNFNELRENVGLNPKLDVQIYNFGLGEENGEFFMERPCRENMGGNRITVQPTQDTYKVTIKKLSDFVKENEIEHPVGLIKIDVEGFEQKILNGCTDIIEQFKPKLFIEVDDNNLKLQNDSAKQLIAYLEKNYTKLYNAENNKAVNSGQDFTNCHFDVIALP
ncbi:MAG: FkbM family methyltransferase [Flavobacteriales bacterium]